MSIEDPTTRRDRRVLGIDLGARRIGVAMSDASRTLATPVRTIEAGDSLEQTVTVLAALLDELGRIDDPIDTIVVGLPQRLDGTPNEQTARVLQIVDRLRARVGVSIHLQDERLSSREAESRLAIRERDWRRRKAKLDAAAAAVILQDYLDGVSG